MGGLDVFFDYVCPSMGVLMATIMFAGTYVRVEFCVFRESTSLSTRTMLVLCEL